jgi:hypothetical protein
MLRDLEAAQSDLGIASYGLSVTTLEEVFLLLADKGADVTGDVTGDGVTGDAAAGDAHGACGGGGPEGAGDDAAEQNATGGGDESAGGVRAPLLPKSGGGAEAAGGDVRLGGWRLYWQQLKALTVKRALCARWARRCGVVRGIRGSAVGGCCLALQFDVEMPLGLTRRRPWYKVVYRVCGSIGCAVGRSMGRAIGQTIGCAGW